ncbi:MAG: thioredoxin [Bacteroidota bacterium]
MKGNFKTLINSDAPVLVDFYTAWCGPCKMQAQILKEVAQAIGDKAKIIKIDVDQNQELANRLQVRGVPTLILFKKGEVLWRNSGVTEKRELVALLRENS